MLLYVLIYKILIIVRFFVYIINIYLFGYKIGKVLCKLLCYDKINYLIKDWIWYLIYMWFLYIDNIKKIIKNYK